MTQLVYAVYDALRSLGDAEDKAKGVTVALSRDNERLMRVEKDVENLRSDARQIKWMLLGLYLAVLATIVQIALK